MQNILRLGYIFFSLFLGFAAYTLFSRVRDENVEPAALIVAFVFLCIGGVGFYFLSKASQKINRQEIYKKQSPDSPWLWNDYWKRSLGEPIFDLGPTLLGWFGAIFFSIGVPIFS